MANKGGARCREAGGSWTRNPAGAAQGHAPGAVLQPGLPDWDAQEIVLNCVKQNIHRKEKGDRLQVCNLKMLIVLKLG